MFSSVPASLPPQRPRRRTGTLLSAATVALGLITVLAACGGGTSQFDPFVPGRVFAFGDEASALTTDADPKKSGYNYGINGMNPNGTADDKTDDTFDCRLQPNWAQSLASAYGFAYPQCPGGSGGYARNWAASGARVADVAQQVVVAEAEIGGFRDKDLATLMVGTNDILELYGLYDGNNEAALLAQARERGNQAGLLVNRLVSLGAKVVVSNIPELGLTPFAFAENAANPGSDRAALLSRLSAAFNERLGVTLLLDGRFVAYVQADQRFLAMSRAPANFLLNNVTDAACATPPPACTNNTLVTDATASGHLWAAGVLMGSRGHDEVAKLAIARAQRNPF